MVDRRHVELVLPLQKAKMGSLPNYDIVYPKCYTYVWYPAAVKQNLTLNVRIVVSIIALNALK